MYVAVLSAGGWHAPLQLGHSLQQRPLWVAAVIQLLVSGWPQTQLVMSSTIPHRYTACREVCDALVL
jgi:hypothetical protein